MVHFNAHTKLSETDIYIKETHHTTQNLIHQKNQGSSEFYHQVNSFSYYNKLLSYNNKLLYKLREHWAFQSIETPNKVYYGEVVFMPHKTPKKMEF